MKRRAAFLALLVISLALIVAVVLPSRVSSPPANRGPAGEPPPVIDRRIPLRISIVAAGATLAIVVFFVASLTPQVSTDGRY
jgi:hypothetical protein